MLRPIIVLMLAIICGGAAAYGVLQLRKPASPGTAEEEMAQILVARQYLAKGQELTEKDVVAKPWPSKYVPPDAILELTEIKGRIVLVPMVADDPVIRTKLAGDDSGSGLAGLVDEGMRAFTIQANTAASNVAGFVRPGNIVDILWHRVSNSNDETGGGTTQTLLQAVEILAVDQVLDESTGKVAPELKSITFEVTPDQVNKVNCAKESGTLSLALRNPKDRKEADAVPATVRDITFLQMAPQDQKSASVSDNVKAIGNWVSDLFTATAKQTASGPRKKRPNPQIMTIRGDTRGNVLVSSP